MNPYGGYDWRDAARLILLALCMLVAVGVLVVVAWSVLSWVVNNPLPYTDPEPPPPTT